MEKVELQHLSEAQRIEVEKYYERELDGAFDGLLNVISDAIMQRDQLALYFIQRGVSRLLLHASNEIDKEESGKDFVWSAKKK